MKSWIRTRVLCCLMGLVFGAWGQLGLAQSTNLGSVSIEVFPETVLIETGKGVQLLNFDFLVDNPTSVPLTLFAIHLRVYDASKRLVLKKFLDSNGFPATSAERGDASIQILHGTKVDAQGTLSIFNPFYSFDPQVELVELQYSIDFLDGNRRLQRFPVVVRPKLYEAKTDLILPLRGLLLVRDGHDFYSHHRRFSLNHPLAKRFSIDSNASRYATDFCVVDQRGRLFEGNGNRHDEWFGWGVPVYAPGDGVVLEARSSIVDNPVRNGKAMAPNPYGFKDLSDFIGNYVAIDHGQGEFSYLGHLKQGSVKVKKGDKVRQGELIAELGLSGSTDEVHLHYQLQSGFNPSTAEGLPSYFTRYRRVLGSRSVDVESGAIDTGDLVTSRVTSER